MSGVGSKQPLLGAVRCYPEISGVSCQEPSEYIILLTTDFLFTVYARNSLLAARGLLLDFSFFGVLLLDFSLASWHLGILVLCINPFAGVPHSPIPLFSAGLP